MRYPHARELILPEEHAQPSIKPIIVIFHSAASVVSPFEFFLTGTKLESHFWVGLDGFVEQYIDTETQADANYHANRFKVGGQWCGAISIETANHREHVRNSTWDRDPWSDEQIDALASLGDWISDSHDIPRRLCPGPYLPGYGWHIMWGSPGEWTPVNKACPGRTRISQVQDEILPLIRGGGVSPPKEEVMPVPIARLVKCKEHKELFVSGDGVNCRWIRDGDEEARMMYLYSTGPRIEIPKDELERYNLVGRKPTWWQK